MYKYLGTIGQKMMTKSQQIRIKKNIKLNYTELLSQLINEGKIMRTKNQKKCYKSFNNELLFYSAHHDCQNLWKLQNIIENKNNDKIQENPNQLLRNWPSITKFGLKELFEPRSQKLEQTTFKNILKFLQQTQQILAQKTSQNTTNNFTIGTMSNLLFLTYGLPTVYPLMLSSFAFRQSFKQSYVLTLNQLFSQYQEQMKSKSFRRLFPVQLFNISDQPLLKDLYFKYYLSENSEQSLKQHHANLAFFARFGLPCYSYIRLFLKSVQRTIKQRPKTNQVSVLQQDINISSCLFIILRKILCVGAYPTKEINEDKKQILTYLKQIFNQLSITKQIRQINSDFTVTNQSGINHTINFLLQVKKNCNQKVIVHQKKVSSMLKQLFQMFNIKDFKQQKQLHSVNVLIDVKIARYLLLYLHLFLEDSSNVDNQLECIKKLLNAKEIQKILKNILLVSDNLAQIVYAQQRYQFLIQKILFQSKDGSFQRDMMQMRKLFCLQIDTIKNFQTTNIHILSNRRHNDDYLLSQESRLIFHPLNSLNQKRYSKNENISSQILNCLQSDREFMSSFVIKSYEQLGQKLFKINPKIATIREESSKYPFLPNFSIKNLNEQCLELYLRNEICQHARIQHSKPHLVHDVRSLNQFQKLICQISSVSWK